MPGLATPVVSTGAVPFSQARRVLAEAKWSRAWTGAPHGISAASPRAACSTLLDRAGLAWRVGAWRPVLAWVRGASVEAFGPSLTDQTAGVWGAA